MKETRLYPSGAGHRVAVIIPVYNGEKYIAQAIESVLAQTYKDIEIVIVDDGSTDGTFERVLPYASRLKYIFQENSGVCTARNTGILNSTGGLICFLDHDDMWHPDKIRTQVEFLSANPGEQFVHCAVRFINSRGEETEPEGYWRRLRFNREVTDVRDIFMHFAMLPSTMMMKRELVDEVGSWRQEFALCEGYNLCLRIASAHALRYIDEPLVSYRIHDANYSNTIYFDMKRIKVVESFLMSNPGLRKTIGKENVRKRLLQLYADMGQFLLSVRDYEQARKYFLKAYLQSPSCVEYFMRFLWYSLTAGQRKTLTWYGARLGTGLKNG